MKKLYLIPTFLLGALFFGGITYAAVNQPLLPSGGGTGISSTTAPNIGNCLKVLNNSPFVYELGSCGGSGVPNLILTVSGGTTYLQASTTGNAWLFPDGFLSTASSTVNSTFNLPTLSDGALVIYGGTVLSNASTTYNSPLSYGAGAVTLSTAGTWSGNAGTASALFANGANCSAGSYPLGVDAAGAVEGCTVASAGGGSAENEWQTVTIGGTLYLQPTSTIAVFDRSGYVSNASSTQIGNLTFSAGTTDALSTLTVNYENAATTTIPNNLDYAWSIGTSTVDIPWLSLNTLTAANTGAVATGTITGGFVVNNGNITDDGFSAYIGNLGLGNTKLADDCGVCQWIDQNVTVAAGAASTTQSYTASFMNGTLPGVTLYGVQNAGVEFESGLQVGIASTTPFAWFSVEVSSSSPIYSGAVRQPLFYIGDQGSTTMPTSGFFSVENGGAIVLGGNLNATSTSNATIADSSCGTAPAVEGDTVGTLLTGSVAPTECTVIFATPFNGSAANPARVRCFASQTSGTASAFNVSASSTGMTLSATALSASTRYDFACVGSGGYLP